jgi:nucleoside phosphorylase
MSLPSDSSCHAYFFLATVGGKSIVCMKSNFHPKVQTAATTIFFEKIVGLAGSPNFHYLITSGTSGGIWATLDVGDVVVSNSARYGLTATVEKQSLRFTGTSDITGSSPPAGYATWYDYANDAILKNGNGCVNTSLATSGGRLATGSPAIYYQPSGSSLTDVVTNSRISDSECTRIVTYRTLGATLDENDAYVAEACLAVQFSN